MHCHEVQKHSSEYIDHFLEDGARERILDHVAGCAACRDHVQGTRRVIASLRTLPPIAPPSDLFERTIMAIDREVEPAMTIVTRRHFRLRSQYSGSLVQYLRQLLVNYEFNLISYGVGVAVSVVLFGFLLASLRPVLSISPFEPPSTHVVWMNQRQSDLLANARGADVLSMPRISNGDWGLGYPDAGAVSDDDDLVVVAEVSTDGRGSIVEVLNGPRDQRAVGELASALGRPRTFVPACATTGRPIASKVVLGFYRVDIWG